MFWGLMQIWWLGFAEPLYKEAGAKAPASLAFLLDKVSDRGIALPLPSCRRARPEVTFQNTPQDARNPRRTKCAAGVSCMSEDVLKSSFRAGPEKNSRLQVDVRFLDRERLREVARTAVTRRDFLKLGKLLRANTLRDRAAGVETATGRRIQR